MLYLLIFWFHVCLSMSTKFDFNTTAPVIGILTQPLEDHSQLSSVAQSYVAFLEMAGARTVPIHWDSNNTVQDDLMAQINGLVFQGGDVTLWNQTSGSLSPYAASGCRLLKEAIQMNQHGDFFPIWGVCLGFELMLMCLSDNPSTMMGHFLDTHQNHALIFTDQAEKSNFFGQSGSEIYRIFQNMRAMHFNHQHGIALKRFLEDFTLVNFFNYLAVDKDDFGELFVSAIEGKNIPFFGLQFHPEKGPFEWYIYNNFPSSYEAIQSSWHLANYFVNHTRISTHAFKHDFDCYHQLIYRYPLADGIYASPRTKGLEVGYEQVYLFPTQGHDMLVNRFEQKL